MKNQLPSSRLACFAAAALFAAAGLGVSPTLAQPVTKVALLENLARHVIATNYQELAASSQALTAAAELLATSPTPEAVEKTRQAWQVVKLAARRMQWLQSGPIAEHEWLATFYYGKALPVRIDEFLNADPAAKPPQPDELSGAAKGLCALEYLLFEERSAPSEAGPAPGTLAANPFAGAAGSRRCQYVLILAHDIQRKASRLTTEWAAPGAQDAAARFRAGGQKTINTLVNELTQNLETIAEKHLNFALQLPAPVMQQLDRIEGARSRSVLPQLTAMLQGTRQAWRGGEGAGLDDLLQSLNPAVAARVAQQFPKAAAALQAIDLPLEEAVTNRRESVKAAYQAVRDLEILFKVDVASALGVTITFDSNDGD